MQTIRIGFMSPMSNVGTSSIALLLGHAMAIKGRSVVNCYTDYENLIGKQVGLPTVEDPLKSIDQLTRLIDINSIKPSDIVQYAYKWDKVKDVYILPLCNIAFTEEVRVNLISDIFNKISTDIAICDVTETIDSPLLEPLLKDLTILYIVTNMSQKGLNLTKEWLNDPRLAETKVVPIINFYSPEIMPFERVCDKMGKLVSDVEKFHYNPYIVKCAMTNTLNTLAPTAFDGDARTVNIKADLDSMMQTVSLLALGKPASKFDLKRSKEKFLQMLRMH